MPPLVPSSVSGTLTRLGNYSALVVVELGSTPTVKPSNPCRNTSFEKVPVFSNPPGLNQGLGRHHRRWQQLWLLLGSHPFPLQVTPHSLQTAPAKAPHAGAVNPEQTPARQKLLLPQTQGETKCLQS